MLKLLYEIILRDTTLGPWVFHILILSISILACEHLETRYDIAILGHDKVRLN